MPVGQAPTTDIGTPDLWFATEGQGLQSQWWETTPDLLWPQSVTTYARMRHDPQLTAVLQAYRLPIMRANWAIDPAGCRDEVVKHVADDLGIGILGADDKPGPARRQGVIWPRHLRLAMDNLVYGHMPFELRYRIDSAGPGGTHLDHLGPRMPWTIARIMLNRDATVKEIYQTTQNTPIPADRLIWYVTGQEGANWAGVSMMRPAYGAWLLKHETWRVHATSIRRFGMGVPVVEGPPGGTTAQIAQAQQLASAMRVGDQTGVGLPQGYKASLMGVTGSVPDAMAFIQYLDTAMAKMALAGLIELGQSQRGSRALGETFLDLFLLSLQAVADELATTATSGQDGMPGIVSDLVAQNWGEDEPIPRVACTDVGEGYQVTAQAIAMLMAAHALTPDADLEAWVRRTWRLPDAMEPGSPGGPPIAPVVPGGPGGLGGPGGSPPDTGSPRPAQPTPAGFADRPSIKPPSPVLKLPLSPSRGGVSAAAAGLRPVTEVEAASGFDPAYHQAVWQQQLAALVAAYRPVLHAQETGLVDEVVSAVDAGRVDRLASLVPDSAAGASLIRQAMILAAEAAADATITEAASQGVVIPPESVAVSQTHLGALASVYAGLDAARMSNAAAAKAAQAAVAGPGKPQAAAVGDEVHAALAGLSDRPLADNLGAALTAAQNHGRLAALAAAPDAAAAGAEYVASEILDANTCGPCKAIDQAVFTSLGEAVAAYPNGGYLGCLGGMRCRGTVVAVWHQPPGEAEVGLAAAWAEALHPRGHGGRFAHVPGGGGKVYNEIPETRGVPRGKGVMDTGRSAEDAKAVSAWRAGHLVAPPITKAEARDEARPVSMNEFQSLAAEGLTQLGQLAANHKPITGLDARWGQVKKQAWGEVSKSWGGATFDAHSGKALPQGANRYALTVKPHGLDKVSVPEGATQAEFNKAMDQAKTRFRAELEKGQRYLGVFHDDDEGRIDIDPVVVVDSLHEVETIGAYTHAIGGAYNFADSNGYWPPYVDEPAGVAAAGDLGRKVHFAGPGQWRSQAEAAQAGSRPPDAALEPQ